MGDDDKELELGSYGMERRLGGKRRPMVVPTYWCGGRKDKREGEGGRRARGKKDITIVPSSSEPEMNILMDVMFSSKFITI